MARELRCDICKRPTQRVVAKLYFTPTIPGVQNGVHSNYSHHADVGICCKDKLLRGFNFRKRTTAAEYHERRKTGAA